MAGFDFDPARLEGSFSQLQPVNDTVQRADSTTPGCCLRTRVTLECRGFERGYRMELPLRTKLPNESPSDPPHNHQSFVTTAQLPMPVLQVISTHEGAGVAEIITTAAGPAQCPPGAPSRIRLEGIGGGTKEVPFTTWAWPAPAILDAALMETLDEDLISLLHPFKLPSLPAQVWKLDFPGCTASKITGTIAAYPDVRWQGRLTLAAKPKLEVAAGFETSVEGDLACTYNGRRFPLQEKAQASALCKWLECVDVMARCAVSLMELRPGPRHAGLDNPRLTRHEAFRFHPWPRLTLSLEASLFEQEGNGLLGQALRLLIQGEPLLGASGEMSLLGPWLEQADKAPLLSPLLAALDVVRSEEISQEIGLWLVGDGDISLRAGIEARRPLMATTTVARASGSVRLGIQARSVRDYDGFLIHQGGGAGDVPAGFHAACTAPEDAPQQDPKERPCSASIEFTGLHIRAMEKWRPGCRFRRLAEPPADTGSEEKTIEGCLLAPSRAWPGEPGTPAPIPWST
jgi:hypothetical protein